MSNGTLLAENVVLRAAIEGFLANDPCDHRLDVINLPCWHEKFKELISRESIVTSTVLEIMRDLYERGKALEPHLGTLSLPRTEAFMVGAYRKLAEVGAIPQ